MSATTLAAFYLEPKIQDHPKLFGLLDIEHVAPAKLWLLVLILLAYFLARFILSEPFKKAFSTWRSEFEAHTKRRYAKEFKKMMPTFLKDPSSKHEVLTRQGGMYDPFFNLTTTKARPVIIDTTVDFIGDSRTDGHYTATINFVAERGITQINQAFNFHVSEDFLLHSRRWGWLKTQITSNLAFEVHLPILTASAAIYFVVSAMFAICSGQGCSCLL